MKSNLALFNQLGLTSARLQYQCAARDARLAINRGERVTRKLVKRVIRPALAKLQAEIAADIAPTIQAMRDTEAFIASGKSLIGWLKEKSTNQACPAWQRPKGAPLPVGLKMPSGKCLAPKLKLDGPEVD